MEMNEILLENETVQALLWEQAPAVLLLRYKPTGGELDGRAVCRPPSIQACIGADPVFPGLLNTEYDVERVGGRVTYRAVCTAQGGEHGASFRIDFELTEDGLSVRFGDVEETGDLRLMSVELHNLAAVRGGDCSACLAIPADCGRLVAVDRAMRHRHAYQIDWLHPVLAGFVNNSHVAGSLDTDSIENELIAGVEEQGGVNYGTLSMRVIYRIGHYDLRENGFLIPAVDPAYFLKVQERSVIRVNLAGGGDGHTDWTDGARQLRNRLNARANPYYADKVVTEIALDLDGGRSRITFDETLELIRQFSALTDGLPLVLYLVGWQYSGHDTGYPAVDLVNERLGGPDAMLRLMEGAKAYNANVSLFDNYDDANPSSPQWDPEMIALDTRGQWMKTGSFLGGQAYLISNWKYAQEAGLRRVRDTLARYPVRDTYHIDVLAGGYKGGRRYDFNPECPSGAVRNLQGKFRILEEFARHGVDVTTEDFSSLFIGLVSHFWHLADRGNAYFQGEQSIPLVPFLYHAMAAYGQERCSEKRDIVTAILNGAYFCTDLTKADFLNQVGMHYLVTLPFLKLYGKTMASYERLGSLQTIVYEDGSIVEADLDCKTYRVTVEGQVIAKDFTTFVSMKPGVWLAYSLEGGRFSYELPDGRGERGAWELSMLCADGRRPDVPFSSEGGIFSFPAQAGTSYRLARLE